MPIDGALSHHAGRDAGPGGPVSINRRGIGPFRRGQRAEAPSSDAQSAAVLGEVEASGRVGGEEHPLIHLKAVLAEEPDRHEAMLLAARVDVGLAAQMLDVAHSGRNRPLPAVDGDVLRPDAERLARR